MRNSGIPAAMVAAMALWAGGCQAQEASYVFLGSSEGVAGFAERAVSHQGKTTDLKVMIVPHDVRPNDRSALYFGMARVRFDCEARTSSRISLKNYNDIGDLLSEDGAGSPEPVDQADAIDLNAFKLACALPGAPDDMVFTTSTAAMKWWRLQ